jgi:sRNA-binding carbon storage regulator CsrA
MGFSIPRCTTTSYDFFSMMMMMMMMDAVKVGFKIPKNSTVIRVWIYWD